MNTLSTFEQVTFQGSNLEVLLDVNEQAKALMSITKVSGVSV